MLERVIVTWALIPDTVGHAIRSAWTNDKYAGQSFGERLSAIYSGRVLKYHKLLTIKQQYGGSIPEKTKRVCKRSPCGYTRLYMAYLKKV